jgi:hypothetical protein
LDSYRTIIQKAKAFFISFFTFVSSVTDETKVKKIKSEPMHFWGVELNGRTTLHPKTRIGQTIHQPDIVCFFIEFSRLELSPKGPLLYAGASDILKRA